MDKNEIDKNDYAFLIELIKISSKLNSYLNSMYYLEINGKKESIEYKNFYFDYVKLLEEERKKYESIDNVKFLEFINYIKENMILPEYNNNINCILKQQYQDIIIRRVLSKLVLRLKNIVEITNADELDELIKRLATLKLKQNNEIEKAIIGDSLMNFLVLIEEEIKNPISKELINKFKKLKYDILFISEYVEIEMLRTSFNTPNEIYIQSQLLSDLSNFDGDMLKQFLKRQLFLSFEQSDRSLEKIKMIYGLNYAMNQIVELLDYTDSDYSEKDKLFLSILRQTFLKSLLLILNKDSINEIDDFFNKKLNDKRYLDIHDNDTISRKIINSIINGIKEKRDSIKILSLIRY